MTNRAQLVLQAIGKALNSIAYTARIAVEEPVGWHHRVTIVNESHWPLLGGMLDETCGRKWGVTGKTRFEAAAAEEAECAVHNARTRSRAAILGFLVGVVISVLYWVFLFLGAHRQGTFVAASAIVITMAALISLPLVVAARWGQPLRLLGASAAGVSCSAASLGFSDTHATITTITTGDVPSGAEVGGAFLVFAMSSAVGAICATVAQATAQLIANHRQRRRFALATVVITSAELVSMLSTQGSGLDAECKKTANSQLRVIVACLRRAPRALLPSAPDSRELVNRRFEYAAQAMSEYQAWVALEQPTTTADLIRELKALTMVVLTGFYHNLPLPQDTSANRTRSSSVSNSLHVMRQVVAGFMPAALIFALPPLGIRLPDPVHQWISGLALVWFVAKLISLIGPSGSAALDSAHEFMRTGSRGSALTKRTDSG